LPAASDLGFDVRVDAPARLWIVRHGESAGNLAWREAVDRGLHRIEVSARDADVPLSPLGERQARALGEWFAAQPVAERPTVLLSSPYRRAADTMGIVAAAAGLGAVSTALDERLREKELGAINRLTRAGILATMPEQAELRQTLGKFYYRPPGGESWCDVLLRLRSVWADLRRDHAGENVLVVCHSVITLCARHMLEGLSEAETLAIDAASDIANCALTAYVVGEAAGGRPRMILERFNFTAPLSDAGEPVTREPDAPRPK
jgi:probable phosphoglycerate mutase